jgi:hypothetical protein
MAVAVGGCAPTTSTGSLPVEVLVILDSGDNSLHVVSVDTTDARRTISLEGLSFVATDLATRGSYAVVAGRAPTAGAALIDLALGTIVRTYPLLGGSVNAITIPDLAHAFVANSDGGTVAELDLTNGGVPAFIPAPGGPRGLAAVRGKVFSVIGNRLPCSEEECILGPSWLIQVDRDLPRDSVQLSGPGNAGPAIVGTDGNLYVLSAGQPLASDGRLSVVDPLRNTELAVFSGVGPVAPAWMASDGGERVLIASPAGGLMVYNIRERRMTLPFGSGIPLEFPTGMFTDALGRIYVPQRGTCADASSAKVRVFAPSLVERQPIAGFICPIAGAIAEVAADRIFTATP